jgi:histone deacetylase complex regulatory component SIN3
MTHWLTCGQVKGAFQETPEVYHQFLDTMKGFKATELEVAEVRTEASRTTRGDP